MEDAPLPPRLKNIQLYAKYFVPGLTIILGILLFVPQIREPLDIKIRINKDMFLTVWQLGVLFDLLLLFPCLILRGESKLPFYDKFTRR
jgi:hypothetical protein